MVCSRQGEKRRWEWDELCLRIQELQAQSKGAADKGVFTDDCPINEILRVHKSIRIEMDAILETSMGLSESLNPNTVSALAERCNFLGRMVGSLQLSQKKGPKLPSNPAFDVSSTLPPKTRVHRSPP